MKPKLTIIVSTISVAILMSSCSSFSPHTQKHTSIDSVALARWLNGEDVKGIKVYNVEGKQTIQAFDYSSEHEI